MKISSHEYDLSGASWHKSSYSDASGGNCLEAARDFPGAATWHKSSYSGASGGDCVEVGAWRKSTHSGASGGNCLEVGAWRKSTHSGGSGGDCLEVAHGLTGIVPVRDSKIPAGPVLTFPARTWAVFISQVKAEQAA